MFITLIDALRYIVNGLFTFFALNEHKENNFIKIALLSIIYALILTTFKFFLIDNQIIVPVYILAIFSILMIISKPQNFKFSILYSFSITCLTEYIHFFIFKIVSITREFLKIEEITYSQPTKLIIGRLIILILYAITVFIIYKFKKPNINFVKKFSNYIILHAFLGVALLIITCLKYCIKYTQSNKLHNLLSVVFVGFMAIYFVFMFSSKTFINIIEGLTKKKLNLAIEESKLQKSKGFIGLKFISEELNSEMNRFLNMLGEINMNTEDKKSKQIACCAVLLNHEENPQETNMISVIYPIVGDILDRQAKTVESNISNAIKTHWSSCSAETLEKIKMNYKKLISPENGCPSAKEFLLYLTQKYKAQYPEDEIKSNAEYSFFKKHLLNIQN